MRSTIRHFEPTDLPQVIAVFRSNIPKYFSAHEESGLRDFLSESPLDYFVLEADREVIGAGGFAANSDDKTVSLCWGMVHAGFLGKGLGRELTEFRILKAREKLGDLPLVITTSQHTQGFYEKLGFRLARHEPDGFGPGIDICEMRRD
jgi:ribosomal protein S18 acetylase RimI-like enzyme